MLLPGHDLQHLTAVRHAGSVLLFGIDAARTVKYAVRRSEPPSGENAEATAWSEWRQLNLPDEAPDPSVAARERDDGTEAWIGSVYSTHDRTALAPLQALSVGEDMYLFRQSLDDTLYVDRFVLDAEAATLVRKLEVRFKRSGERYRPLENAAGQPMDSRDFRDADGNPFFEPTTELRLIKKLKNGWFSVVAVPTAEHDTIRWHVFAYSDASKKIEVTSVRGSADGLFDIRDHVMMGGNGQSAVPALIAGVVTRAIDLKNEEGDHLIPAGRFTATSYARQEEVTEPDGEKQLMKTGLRVLLAVPTGDGGKLAVLSFAVLKDGTLLALDEDPTHRVLHEKSRRVLLPPDVLAEVMPVGGAGTGYTPADLTGRAFNGVDDYVELDELNPGETFTVEMWVNPETTDDDQCFIGKHTPTGRNLFLMQYARGGLAVNLDGHWHSEPNTKNVGWQHLAAVVEKTAPGHSRVATYRNGELLWMSIFPTVLGDPTGRPWVLGMDWNGNVKTDFFHGAMADVRLWSTARTQDQIREGMSGRLLTDQRHLLGRWMFGSDAPGIEVGPTEGAALPRYLNGGVDPAVAYRHEDVVEVEPYATCRERIEFRTDGDAGGFDFVFWGRAGARDGARTEPVCVSAHMKDLAEGWREATARFRIPKGMSYLRCFEITPPAGQWSQLEFRNHTIDAVTDTVTEEHHADEITLETLGRGYVEFENRLARLRQLELEQATLERMLGLGPLSSEVTRLEQQVEQCEQVMERLEAHLAAEKANPFNYWCFLQARHSGRVFDVRYAWTGNGVGLIEWDRTGGTNQQFKFISTEDPKNPDTYFIQARHSQRVLDVAGGSLANDARILQWDLHRGSNQRFRFYHKDAGYYQIIAQHSGKALDVNTVWYWGRTPPIIQYTPHSGHNQQFRLVSTGVQANSSITDIERDIEAVQTRLHGLNQDLQAAQQQLGQPPMTAEEMTALREALREVTDEIVRLRHLCMESVTAVNAPIIAPVIGGDASEALTVTGTLLDLDPCDGDLSVMESVEGTVDLKYLGRERTLRTVRLDTSRDEWLPDPLGTCYALDGDAYIQLTDCNPGETFTAELWASPMSLTNGQCLLSRCDENGDAVCWFGYGDGGLELRLRDRAVSAPGLKRFGWQHLAVVVRRLAPTDEATMRSGITVYRDGERVLGEECDQAFGFPAGGAWVLGANDAGGARTDFFRGHLAEVRIWSTALTREEIRSQMVQHLAGDEPELAGYWPLNPTIDLTARMDALDVEATVHGAERVPVTAPMTRLPPPTMAFDGETSSLTVPDVPALRIASYTVEAWIKPDGAPDEEWKGIVGKPGRNFNVWLHRAGLIHHRFHTEAEWNAGAPNTPVGSIQWDQWNHVAITNDGQTARTFINGVEKASGPVTSPLVIDRTAMYVGRNLDGLQRNANQFKGAIAELRVWNTARTAAQIQADMDARTGGPHPGLVGYWPLDGVARDGRAVDVVGGNDAVADGAGVFPMRPDGIQCVEYGTMGTDTQGRPTAVMRRLHASPLGSRVETFEDARIGALELRWVGNMQFEPTLIGYIEGAPPIPSENLTESEDYSGATAVELQVSEDVQFSWARSQDFGLGMEMSLKIGPWVDTMIAKGGALFSSRLSLGYSWLDETRVSSAVTLARSDRLALKGTRERAPRFPGLGRRFIPKNVGYALVVSALADLFVTRLKGSKRMISYHVRPVEDVPPDVNTVTFLINPAYTMNGALDGLIGEHPAGERFYGHVPMMRNEHGSMYPASYYRIAEAYALKKRIEDEDKQRESQFLNYNSRLVDEWSMAQQTDALPPGEPEDAGQAADQSGQAQETMAGYDQGAGSSGAYLGWQKKMEDLVRRVGKRNIVNTYVWDGDGGLRTETQEFASTVEQTVGGSFALDLGAGIEAGFTGWGLKFDLQLLGTMHLTQTMTKTEARSTGFSVNVDLSCENREITDHDDVPLHPGNKVDRYRFVTFYLEPRTDHFKHFFEHVVDPEWLRSNDEEARVLRQIDLTKPNKTWRLFHRVTYVERPALMAFGVESPELAGEPSVAGE